MHPEIQKFWEKQGSIQEVRIAGYPDGTVFWHLRVGNMLLGRIVVEERERPSYTRVLIGNKFYSEKDALRLIKIGLAFL